MALAAKDIDDILLGIEKLPQPDFNKTSKKDLMGDLSDFMADSTCCIRTALQAMLECNGCGECCRFCNPIVLIEEECKDIAKYARRDLKEFKDKYFQKINNSWAIKKREEDYCPFYEKNCGCVIYDVRPENCRKFPYLSSDIIESFEKNKSFPQIENCPGALALYYKVEEYGHALRENREVYEYARSKVENYEISVTYLLHIYLKNIEFHNGLGALDTIIRMYKISRIASQEELKRISLLFCALQIQAN